MKILKFIVLFVLVLIVAGALYLASIDGSYDVARSRIIQAPASVVYNDLNEYRNWKEWGPWYEQDSTIVVSYSDQTSGEGAAYSWTSEKDGSGEMKTISLTENKRLDQMIIFKTPFGDMMSDVYWIFEEKDNGTEVTWGIKGELPFLSRFMVTGMEENMGPMEERGLELLDKSIQRKMSVYSIEPLGVVDYSGGFYLYITASSAINDLDTRLNELTQDLNRYIGDKKLRPNGDRFTLFHKYDEENGTTMFSVGVPVAERIVTEKGSSVLCGFMERGSYVKTVLKGSYKNSQEAWNKAMTQAGNSETYQALSKGEPFEVYVKSPENTNNPADWITEIYIPVEKK